MSTTDSVIDYWTFTKDGRWHICDGNGNPIFVAPYVDLEACR